MKRRKKTKENDIVTENSQMDENIKTEEVSAEEAPAEEVPVEEAPAEETPVEEAPAEETPVEEVPVEEAPVEEAPVEEAPVEEAPVEEAPVEEAPVEEAPAEETPAEETPKEEKKGIKKGTKIVLITAAAVLVAMLAVYLGFSFYYSERFLMNTTVNGTSCAGKTVEEVEKMMQDNVEKYVLTLEQRHGITEEIHGVDFDIKYNGVAVIEDAMEEQNSFLWMKALFSKNKIKAKVDFDYNSEKLDKMIGELECLKEEKQVQPVSAVPVYKDGAWVIEEEVYGTVIDKEKLYEAIPKSVDAMKTTVDLDKEQCYVPPRYTKDSEEVIAAKDALNKCLEAKITYSLDGIEVSIDRTKFEGWLSVDENLNIIVDENQARAFTDTLGSSYNTPNTAMDLVTPTGKVVTMANGRYGRVVGSAADCAQLIEEIKQGKTVTRAPILSRGGSAQGEPVWGSTYVEVDLSLQHMWYIVNGAVVLETDVVTGRPGMDTPAGIFTILEKKRNKTLVGNIVPETGKPEYETPVAYWMRITWSGVGFHDALWQAQFGGQLNKQGYGSHGCINMPYNAAAALYNKVGVGCPVVIHY